MNTEMWEQAAVQRNWQLLRQDPRYHAAGPGSGLLACDRVGMGRMAEPEEILPYIHSLLHTQGRLDLSGKRILISTGGTREFFDPVRFIGNPATGKMGLALAQAAVHRGGIVTLVHGSLPDVAIDRRIQTISVVTSAQMHDRMLAQFPTADLVIMSAAVADVKPAHYSDQKLPKQQLPTALELDPVPDIIAALSKLRQPHQQIVGFAAQTGDIIPPALAKLERKQLDAIVANPVDLPDRGFGSDRNQAVIIKKSRDLSQPQQYERIEIQPCAKLEMAHQILDWID
jgi:phosphopantothenoylcysteine decarboxylase / phosphopantothenate---cysteine ligase